MKKIYAVAVILVVAGLAALLSFLAATRTAA